MDNNQKLEWIISPEIHCGCEVCFKLSLREPERTIFNPMVYNEDKKVIKNYLDEKCII